MKFKQTNSSKNALSFIIIKVRKPEEILKVFKYGKKRAHVKILKYQEIYQI